MIWQAKEQNLARVMMSHLPITRSQARVHQRWPHTANGNESGGTADEQNQLSRY